MLVGSERRTIAFRTLDATNFWKKAGNYFLDEVDFRDDKCGQLIGHEVPRRAPEPRVREASTAVKFQTTTHVLRIGAYGFLRHVEPVKLNACALTDQAVIKSGLCG